MDGVAGRLATRVQLTTDGLKFYLDALEGAFGADVDYAQRVKIYGASPETAKGRYSPAECTGVERQNLTMRMSIGNGRSLNRKPLHSLKRMNGPSGCLLVERVFGLLLERAATGTSTSRPRMTGMIRTTF